MKVKYKIIGTKDKGLGRMTFYHRSLAKAMLGKQKGKIKVIRF